MTDILVGFDYETYPLGPHALTPKPVCLSAVINADPEAELPDQLTLGEDELELATSGDGDLEELADELLTKVDKLVGHNTAFDLAVMGASAAGGLKSHDVWRKIFEAVAQNKVSDTMIREKLLNLAQYGRLKYLPTPNGADREVKYNLTALVNHYLGLGLEEKTKVRKGEVVGDADAWRLNYDVLDGKPLTEWPEDAIEYSVMDSVYPTLIWRHQQRRAERVQHDIGVDPLGVESFRVMSNLALYLLSAVGVLVDGEEYSRIRQEVDDALQPRNLELLVKEGILRPGSPPVPYANGASDCQNRGNCSKPACECPPKMTKGKAPSVDKKRLEAFVRELGQKNPKVGLRFTDKGNLQVDRAFLDDHAHRSPVLAQYLERAKVAKLKNTYLPAMEWPHGSGQPSDIIHASFDVLKETGRTSSFASTVYPSWNGQNPHPRVRSVIKPRPGYVLYSVDYDGMELVTLAQKCYTLFGHSVLRDVINKYGASAGHTYLGAHLAFYLDEDVHDVVIEECGPTPDGEQLYEVFDKFRASESAEVRKLFKHYRTFAKPTGLGYPGGLGPATFVDYAHATYGIECDEELASELRELWHKTFPEMRLYLDWINESCPDPNHAEAYAYLTPLGMYRANASYCAAANGAGLQSPGAEGALLGLCAVQEATFATPDSILYDDSHGPRHRGLLFLHDELVGEAREDVAHEVAHEVARLMVESMKLVTPDVTPSASPVLMTRWSKAAEPTFDESGRLIPWRPK